VAKPATRVVYIKKKGKGHAHHGGAWKVAYADFVTAMMALFMVLWLVSQTDETTRTSLSRYFRTGVFAGSGHVIGEGLPNVADGPTPGGGSPRLSESERLEDARDRIAAALEALSTDAGGPGLGTRFEATVTDGGLLVRVSDDSDGLAFDLSSAELTPALRAFLEEIGPILGELGNDLQVHGHTDARPFPPGSPHDNWDLSFARADAARRVLEHHGVRAHQIVGVLAHAASAPLLADAPLDPRNRRLAILAVRRGAERAAADGVSPDVADRALGGE
jgi:chemotaxis protein MotB